jgi:DNA-binding beta-propeller fold protein YncE
MLSVPGSPFGVISNPHGVWSFFSVGSTISASEGSFLPVLDRHVSVPGDPLGEALTHNDRYLLAADGSGAVVINVGSLEKSAPNAVVGTLTSPGGSGAIEVLVSPDDRYAFVTLEDTGDMAVFDLAKALAHGFGPQDVVGTVPLGEAPVGMAVSPDGHWIYATSEGTPGLHGPGDGTLSAINLTKAETDPRHAVAASVIAGCSPVRVVAAHDGRTVWVTARASNALLGFSASALLADPSHALVAQVHVGEAPVGLAMTRNGTRIVVADSARFGGARADLAVVDTSAALAGRPALLGTISSGRFPREMAVHGNTLLVTNYSSGQLQAVDIRTLP